MNFQSQDCVALITGSNRGIGEGFVHALLARGASRIYATGRIAESLEPIRQLDPARIVTIQLDVTNEEQRNAAARQATDVTLLINNAGIGGSDVAEERRFLAAENLDDARKVMEIDFFAQAEMCRAFAPKIVANGGGTIVNILSIGALFCVPEFASYSAAKSAAAMMTMGIRAELARDNTLVCAVYTAGVLTRKTKRDHHLKISPLEHANVVLDAAEAGIEDIYVGTGAEKFRDQLRADPKTLERERIERFYENPLG